MSDTAMNKPKDTGQTKHAKRAALLLGLVAVAMYFGFIIATGLKG